MPLTTGPGLFLVAASPTASLSAEGTGPPKFLGNPHADMPRSSTPVEPSSQAVSAFRCCLPAIKRRRLPHFDHFGAQSRGLPAPCLRFAAWVTPRPRKTRFRLLASFTGGDWLLPGFLCKVSDFLCPIFPLTQASLGALYMDRHKTPPRASVKARRWDCEHRSVLDSKHEYKSSSSSHLYDPIIPEPSECRNRLPAGGLQMNAEMYDMLPT